MAVLRESPWYQEILQEGERIGEQRGRQEGEQLGEQRGRQQGRQEEGQLLILKQLAHQVGELSPDTIAQIGALPINQLEALGEALLDFTQTNDLVNWLEQQS